MLPSLLGTCSNRGCRKKKEEAVKKKEQKKILGKGRAKLSFSFGGGA
jgi:hypothetical protein